MHEVSEGLSPVFPGVRRRVLADEGLPVIAAIDAFVIIADGTDVVGGLIAENQVEWAQQVGSIDQNVPIEMTDLMAKMTEEGPVGFAKGDAARLAFGVIGLGEVQRDQSREMPGHDGPTGGLVGQNIERNVPSVRDGHRKLHSYEVVNQAPFR